MRLLIAALAERFRPDTVNMVAAHCFVRGGTLGGGERNAQTIFDYGIEALHFPANANYVALGHLHRTQHMPAPAPGLVPGSPIQVDFGEEQDTKHVLVVEAEAGVPAQVEVRELTTPLDAAHGPRHPRRSSRAMAATGGDAWLRVVVREPAGPAWPTKCARCCPAPSTSASTVELETVPNDGARPVRRGRAPRELFAEYLTGEGVDDVRVVRLFERLHDDAIAEAAG